MLVFLVIHNIFIYDVYIEDIANMKCRIYHLHLEKWFIQKQMSIIADIYASIAIPNLNNWFVI